MTDHRDHFVLEPNDEYPHEPEEAPNYNESMYLNAFDHRRRHGAWFRIGNRVNEGYAEMSVCVYLADGRVGFMFGRPHIDSNQRMEAGGLSIEVIEPLKRLRVAYDGTVCLLERPAEMADPRRAFTTNPHVAARVDLEFVGVSEVFGGRPDGADGREVDPEQSFARAHYEQHTTANGTITVGDELLEIHDGLGLRDKSWGPRSWQSIDWYRWLPIAFGPDLGMTISLRGTGDRVQRGVGMVHHDGRYEVFTDAGIETTWDAEGQPSGLRAVATTAGRSYDLTGEVLSCIPLRNRKPDPDGTIRQTRIAEGFTRFKMGDRVGYGMSEYLDQLTDGTATSPDGRVGPGATGRVGMAVA